MSFDLKQEFCKFSEKLLQSDLYDCTFVVGSDDNSKEFRCLKAHLANVSDVFKAQLYGNFIESSKNRDDAIKLSHCNPDVFECILRASYGLLPNINKNNVIDLIIASKYYNISMLLNQSCKWIKNNINSRNVLKILNESYLNNIIDIKDGIVTNINNETGDKSMIGDLMSVESFVVECLSTIFDNSNKILNQDYFWQSLHINVLMLIIGKDYFVVNEEKLWCQLTKWAKCQAKQENLNQPKHVDINSSENKNDNDNENKNDNDHDGYDGIDIDIDVEEPLRKRIRLSSNDCNKDKNKDENDKKEENLNDNVNINLNKPSNMDIAHHFANDKRKKNIINNNSNSNNNSISKAAFDLLQPLLKYVRFSLMSKKYFGINVKDWLDRNDLEFLFLRKNDWINYRARKSLQSILKSDDLYDICCYTSGSRYELNFTTLCCIWPYKIVQSRNRKDWWFVVDLNVSMKDISHLDEEWKITWYPEIVHVARDSNSGINSGINHRNQLRRVHPPFQSESDTRSSIRSNLVIPMKNGKWYDVEVYCCIKKGMNRQRMDNNSGNDSSNWEWIKGTSIFQDKKIFRVNVHNMKSPFLKFQIRRTYNNRKARVNNVCIVPKCIKYQLNLLSFDYINYVESI